MKTLAALTLCAGTTWALLGSPPNALAEPEQLHHVYVTVYKGLLFDSVEPLARDIANHGGDVKVFWHDYQRVDLQCPDLIVGHSQGGNAAIRQAVDCQNKGTPPKAIVVIDAGRFPQTSVVPKEVRFACASYYDPSHPIGGQYIYGHCKNTRVPGYSHLQMPSTPQVVRGVRQILNLLEHNQ